jgi:hypothetical protein
VLLVLLGLADVGHYLFAPDRWRFSAFLNARFPYPALPWPSWTLDLALFMVIPAVAVGLVHGITSARQRRLSIWPTAWCVLSAAAWGAFVFGACRLISAFYVWDGDQHLVSVQVAATARMTTFGPPLLLLTVVLGLSLATGLLRNHLQEDMREWLASLCARLLLTAVLWAVINLIALYGTALFLWAGPWVQTALASGWLLTVVTGVLAGGSMRTGANQSVNTLRELSARVALPIFVVGIFVMVSLLVHVAVDNPPKFELADESVWPFRYDPERPATQISEVRTGDAGKVEIVRKKDYARQPDKTAAVEQQYWLGMLNTDRNLIWNRFFWLDDDDVKFLERHGASTHVLQMLRKDRRWSSGEFRDELRRRFPSLPQPVHDTILKKTQEHWALPVSGASIVGLAASSTGEGPFPAVSAVAAGRSEQADKDTLGTFVFKISFLNDTDLPKNFSREDRYTLENLQYYRWHIEEFQDTVDQLLPEAWNQQIRRKFLQKIKGPGTELKPNYGSFLLKIGGWLVGCGILLTLAARQVDVNAFSLHGLYLNRLARAYLGLNQAKTAWVFLGNNTKTWNPFAFPRV